MKNCKVKFFQFSLRQLLLLSVVPPLQKTTRTQKSIPMRSLIIDRVVCTLVWAEHSCCPPNALCFSFNDIRKYWLEKAEIYKWLWFLVHLQGSHPQKLRSKMKNPYTNCLNLSFLLFLTLPYMLCWFWNFQQLHSLALPVCRRVAPAFVCRPNDLVWTGGMVSV